MKIPLQSRRTRTTDIKRYDLSLPFSKLENMNKIRFTTYFPACAFTNIRIIQKTH